ncbi:MAG: AI-2E family transporter [Desulfobacterales bacterium]|nr:AI-2E family transporter [Desulfobacterales bacterium]
MEPENTDTEKNHLAHYFLIFILLLTLYACFHIIKPYLNPIILALILSTLFQPVHLRIERRLKNRKNLASAVSCLLLTFVVIIPIMIMLIAVLQQGIKSFHAIYDWLAAGGFEKLSANVLFSNTLAYIQSNSEIAERLFPNFDLQKINLNKMLLTVTANAGKTLISHGGHIVGNITAMIANFFLMIFVFFFTIRDQEKIFKSLLHLSPLSSSHEEQILEKIKAVSGSALLGTLVTALAQGIAGTIAFWICGLPGLFWGAAMAFASLIPIVGTALIWVPAAGYLFLSGSWGYGIFMVVWCAVVVGSIDNFVRPLFMQGSAGMSTLLIFFAIIGGINTFGLLGILYGPLIFGLLIVLLYIYRIEFEGFLTKQDQS